MPTNISHSNTFTDISSISKNNYCNYIIENYSPKQALQAIQYLIQLPSLNNKERGELAELATVYTLLGLQHVLDTPCKIFNNVLLKTPNGSTEIDSLFVSPHALFVIETKSFYGKTEIADDEDSTFYTYSKHGNTTTTPIKQNAYHRKVLLNLLKGVCDEKYVRSVINLFSIGELIDSRQQSKRNEVAVVNIEYMFNYLYQTTSKIKKLYPSKFETDTPIKFQSVCSIIQNNNIYSDENMLDHIARIKARKQHN